MQQYSGSIYQHCSVTVANGLYKSDRRDDSFAVPQGSCPWHYLHLPYIYFTCAWPRDKCKMKSSIKLRHQLILAILEHKSIRTQKHIDHSDMSRCNSYRQSTSCYMRKVTKIGIASFTAQTGSPSGGIFTTRSIPCKVKICRYYVRISRN